LIGLLLAAALAADALYLSPIDLSWQGVVCICPVKVHFSDGPVSDAVDTVRGNVGGDEYAYCQQEDGLITHSTIDTRAAIHDVETLVAPGRAGQRPDGVVFATLDKRAMAYPATEFRYYKRLTVTRTGVCRVAVRK
jgi:hypothetical protein